MDWAHILGVGGGWPSNVFLPLALATVATVGYMIGRRRQTPFDPDAVHTRLELRKARAVARELERTAQLVRKHISRHRRSLRKFKGRIEELEGQSQETAWKELCREADEILRPTLRLSSQIAHAYDEIRQQTNHLMAFTDARTDPLTGVSNRRALDEVLRSQLAMHGRYRTEFTLVLFDIDHFKKVNDREGHLQGDRILQEVARLLDDSARETDTVARYGGEEFVVVMPETGLLGASTFSERVRQAVEATVPVTISGGVTVALDGDTTEDVLNRADAALYAAKAAGRNCVYRHDGHETESVVEVVPAEPV
ncbi:MAG: GGDEF domain-containing protein [Pirellulales bacterium]|nr:GGDEF domain-containing protein [Pirellulales bacterium]